MVLSRGARAMPISRMEEVITIDFHRRDSSWDKSDLVFRGSAFFNDVLLLLLSLPSSSTSSASSASSIPSNLSASNSAS